MVDLEIPEEAKEEAAAGREALLEALVEVDDGLMEAYLADEELHINRLREVIRAATIDLKLTPVFAGAALRNKGVQPLLDGIVDYLPAPTDLPPIEAHTPGGETVLI